MKDKEKVQEEEILEDEEIIEDDEQDKDDSSEELERAKKLGFKTDDEYTGNPKYKLSAKEYLERAEKGGIVKKLQSDVTESNRKIDEMTSAFAKMQKFTQLQINSAKERALEDLRARQVKSVEDGTEASEAFDTYEREKIKVEKQYTPESETTKIIDVPEITRFYQENAWYDEDEIMQGAANALHRSIINKHPNMPLSEQLDMVKKRIVERFPDKFANPKKRIQSIEGGGSVHISGQKRETFRSLGFSANDINDAHQLIKSGTFKDEADFIKSYLILNKGRK